MIHSVICFRKVQEDSTKDDDDDDDFISSVWAESFIYLSGSTMVLVISPERFLKHFTVPDYKVNGHHHGVEQVMAFTGRVVLVVLDPTIRLCRRVASGKSVYLRTYSGKYQRR